MGRQPSGWTRMGIAAASIVVGGLVLAGLWEQVWGLLRWIDWLMPRPGLSGFVLLALSPVAFLLLASLVRWISLGFEGEGGDAD